VRLIKSKILSNFLEGRDRTIYIASLKAAAISARWTEIREAIAIRKGSPVNDATVHNVLEKLKAAMLIDEKRKRLQNQ